MVRIRWLSSANETGVRTDEAQVDFVAVPLGLGMRQNALVDPTLSRFR